jgi:hypothetical protein
MGLAEHIAQRLLGTIVDVTPIIAILAGFQLLVLRRPPAHLGRIVIGLAYVLVGLALFLVGLERALFPLGRAMAAQLTDPAFIYGMAQAPRAAHWADFGWVYVFGATIGFSSAVAEPALIAVALKAEEVSGRAIDAFGLRIAVATGVAAGVAVGCFRIVTGTPLPFYIMAVYVLVIGLTWRSSRTIVPLAYDSGGVTTSTVTVPVLAALGLGLASAIPGRSPLIDGFGMIAFACSFPIISVLSYAGIIGARRRRRHAVPLDPSTPEEKIP